MYKIIFIFLFISNILNASHNTSYYNDISNIISIDTRKSAFHYVQELRLRENSYNYISYTHIKCNITGINIFDRRVGLLLYVRNCEEAAIFRFFKKVPIKYVYILGSDIIYRYENIPYNEIRVFRKIIVNRNNRSVAIGYY